MEDLKAREERLGMKTVIEWEQHSTNKRLVWWRMVTIERGGLRHNLTTWRDDTPAALRKRAKFEGVELVQLPTA